MPLEVAITQISIYKELRIQLVVDKLNTLMLKWFPGNKLCVNKPGEYNGFYYLC